MKRKTKNLLRISELAERAGVSPSTIKHYVNEGLVPKALKTGKNMAYYDVSCVTRIKLIKKMQKERFLPLDVIKRVIDSKAPDAEEMRLGEAILKTHRQPHESQRVMEAQVSHRTGYPRHKIALLEKEGLVLPESGEEGKSYDSVDLRIIETIKKREESGLPFDYSLATIRFYRDAIRKAVEGDMHFFVQTLFGSIPTRQAVTFMTDADDLLDNFMVLYRQKLLRHLSSAAIRKVNELPGRLALISCLPVRLDEGIASPPDGSPLRIVFHLCAGRWDQALASLGAASLEGTALTRPSVTVLAHLLKGDTASALTAAERDIAEPSARMLDNAAAALAHIFAIGAASGFSRPLYLAKRGIDFLRRNDSIRETHPLVRLFCAYVAGSVYVSLPDVFGVFPAGMEALEEVRRVLEAGKFSMAGLPGWLADAFRHEILPALEIRVNRFLADGCLEAGDTLSARKSLERVVSIDSPSGPHAEWARLKLLEL